MLLRVLLLVTVLIIYGSLYPWQFHPPPPEHSPVWFLFHSWPAHADRFLLKDIPINILLYMPFGAAGFLVFLRLGERVAWVAPVLLGFALSASIEMTQLFDAQRVCSTMDLTMNVLGSLCGAAAAAMWLGSGRRTPRLAAEAAAPVVLLCCWAAALLFPLMPDLSRTHLRAKWHLFLATPFSWTVFLASLVEWMIVGRLLQAAGGPFRDASWYVSLLLLLPARYFIVMGGPEAGVFAGAAAGCALWLALARYRGRDVALFAAVLAVIVLAGLAPFHFSSVAQQFSWLPFVNLFTADWQTAFVVFLHKVFLYGAAVWLGSMTGLGFLGAAAVVAPVLAGIEIIQLYIPEHRAEITDPLLAVMWGFFLRWTRAVHGGRAVFSHKERTRGRV